MVGPIFLDVSSHGNTTSVHSRFILINFFLLAAVRNIYYVICGTLSTMCTVSHYSLDLTIFILMSFMNFRKNNKLSNCNGTEQIQWKILFIHILWCYNLNSSSSLTRRLLIKLMKLKRRNYALKWEFISTMKRPLSENENREFVLIKCWHLCLQLRSRRRGGVFGRNLTHAPKSVLLKNIYTLKDFCNKWTDRRIFTCYLKYYRYIKCYCSDRQKALRLFIKDISLQIMHKQFRWNIFSVRNWSKQTSWIQCFILFL